MADPTESGATTVRGPDGTPVALVAMAGQGNARLIAAAPDLLEALLRFVDLSDNEYLGDDPRAVHAVKVARAAIEKSYRR